MRVSHKMQMEVSIVLDEPRAIWLKDLLQNIPNPENETTEHKQYRKEIFEGLREHLKMCGIDR